MISIVVWKWKGNTMGHTRPDYGPKHVNRLRAMVERNLRLPHEVVCVTDDPAGIDSRVRIVPLWSELRQHGRCFVRLKAFARDMHKVLGARFLSLDLDTVITGDITPLVERPESFVIWADPSRLLPYCGSMWMLSAGAHPEVYEKFDYAVWQTLKPRNNWHGSDQAWMAHMLPGAATWTRADGVYSFRMDILKARAGDMLGKRQRRRIRILGGPLPSDARIVHFHGIYDPSQRFLRDTIPWIDQHWRAE